MACFLCSKPPVKRTSYEPQAQAIPSCIHSQLKYKSTSDNLAPTYSGALWPCKFCIVGKTVWSYIVTYDNIWYGTTFDPESVSAYNGLMRRKLKLNVGDVVEVEWLDTAFFADEEDDDVRQAEKDGGVLVYTLGYLKKFNNRSITIFSEKFVDGTGKCSYTIIPKRMIVNVKLFKAVNK